MNKISRHAEWLNLIEKSGPFLVPSVLEAAFPQGLEAANTAQRRNVRNAFNEWTDAINDDDPLLPELHAEWIRLILYDVLEFDDQSLMKSEEIPKNYSIQSPLDDEFFMPDMQVVSPASKQPRMFVSTQPPGTDLDKAKKGSGWPVSLMDRMTQLCRTHNVRLGLLTNGSQWMLVNAPDGETSSNTSWFARLWLQEPVTFQAFQSLLGVRRFFGPEDETLEKLLQKSTEQQEEITDTLGEQVRRAVEVLTQCLDKVDADRNRQLLKDVPPSELYEAGLTVMMRLVFTMCAEERGLLHLDDPTYEANYAVSSLRNQLEEEADRHGFEVLERKHDAWARLLAVFRAIYGGIEHEDLRLPALGGSLFDPDRFPFLEGRKKGTNWKEIPSKPLPIDNRTVLLLLSALQVLEQSGGALLLSYKALDVEQIGHVYEGLLEHTVERLPTTTLGLIGSKKAKYPNLSLSEVESLLQSGTEDLSGRIKEVTLRSESAIRKGLVGEINDDTYSKIAAACGGDVQLADRIRPFGLLLRSDAWGELIVYQKDSFAVTLGSDRRETGTHYTPKSLTETIVKATLEPVVFHGPTEGKPHEEWILKSSKELLDLKICDPAMGSGAFLVQVCRWLAEKVVEAWRFESQSGKFISAEGTVMDQLDEAEPLDEAVDEQVMIARRLVAEKCLYGVDLNPLAVELAKLSIWLITLAKDRPFGFLDHNLRAGDSLLGIHKIEQLYGFDLYADDKTPKKLFATKIDEQVSEVLVLRKQLRETPIRDVRDVKYMERLDRQARLKLEHIENIADAMIGEALISGGNQRTLETAMDNLSMWAAVYIDGDNETGRKIIAEARKSLSIDLPVGKPPRNPFHWALEFPEVFERGGFDGIVGNPPYLGGKRISGAVGTKYRSFMLNHIAEGRKGSADLCGYFLLRIMSIVNSNGYSGVLATSSIAEGDTREIALEYLLENGVTLYRAIRSQNWPGSASVTITPIWLTRAMWNGTYIIDNVPSSGINSYLSEPGLESGPPKKLSANENLSFQGSVIHGQGFVLSPEKAKEIIQKSKQSQSVITPYLRGEDFNSSPEHKPSCYVINFKDWSIEKAKQYSDCFRIVEQNVKPTRSKLKDKGYREKWWQYGRRGVKLYQTIDGLQRVLFHSFTSKYLAFSFVPSDIIYAAPHVVLAFEGFNHFALLQSTIHESWVRKYTSYSLSLARYTPTDCFETFPFPQTLAQLTHIGSSYFNLRRSIMRKNNIGLVALYNHYHDKNDNSIDVLALREAHIELDKLVLRSYGWNDITLNHNFLTTKRDGLRFTISEVARREILQRLLKLNHERYEEEVKQALHSKQKLTKAKRQAVKQASDSHQTTFLEDS